MYLTENIAIISKAFPDLYEKIKSMEGLGKNKTIRLESARNGMPTLVFENDSGPVCLHSKYDPVTEAGRLISQYNNVEEYKHVFFFGVGLGYHIEEFCKKWPDKRFTLYEPELSILLNYLKEKQLKKLPLVNCKGIYTGSSQGDIEYAVQRFVSIISGEVLFITLPSYEKIFADSYKSFIETFRNTVANKRASLQVQGHFQKLWTTNSMRNFIEVINTPSILMDKKQYFAGKPAIIAAAGPSLEEELDNLRFIREKGLAYIFAAGSAVNALMAGGVYPHAVATYDPAPHNYIAMERFIKESDGNIPLIFGSSTFYEVPENYNGRKYHIISDKDTITQFYLNNEKCEMSEVIMDSPSISIMLLQLLVKLECDPIILVGQNFAYKSNRYYPKGVQYDARPQKISETEFKNAIAVEDVLGGTVYTSITLNHMRRQMEDYIKHFSITNVINSTGGGAKIEGTEYKPLCELITKKITKPNIVEDWTADSENGCDFSYMSEQNSILLSEYRSLIKAIDSTIEIIDELKSLSEDAISLTVFKALDNFNGEFNKILQNKFFDVFLKPMNRVQLDIINRNLDDIRFERDASAKAQKVVECFDFLVKDCKKDLFNITPLFFEINDYISDNEVKVFSFMIQIA